MDINITRFFNECAPMDYSASVAEIGRDAGADTWRAACADSPDYMILDDDEKRKAFRAYVLCFGAWDEAEIAAWSDAELNALLLQMISGDIREASDCRGNTSGFDWTEYEAGVKSGLYSSRMYRQGDSVFYDLSE